METTTKTFRKRKAILAYLCSTTQHPSAETIYTDLKAQIPDLSMGTVYRNLNLFKEQGQVISVATVDGVERFDANTKDHVHFICNHCGAVIDLHEIPVPEDLKDQAASCLGGRISGCQLSFSGVCRECANK